MNYIDSIFKSRIQQWKNHIRSGTNLDKALTVPLAMMTTKQATNAIVNAIKIKMYQDKITNGDKSK